MPTQKTIPEILQIQKISQYLAANDIGVETAMYGGTLDQRLALMIMCEGLSVQWKYETNPAKDTIRGTANYLYEILGKYALQAERIINGQGNTKPVVTGPSDQSVEDGNIATFTISVSSTIAYAIQWYKNGVAIVGATSLSYSFVASMSDNGAEYSAVVTNAAGSTISRNGLLSVTGPLVGYVYYGDTDYYNELQAGNDNITYNFSFPITDGAPLQITLPPDATPNKWLVFKYPTSQSVKTLWVNTVLNQGNIPDFNMRSIITIGSFYYIVSRQDLSMDVSSSPNLIFS